MPKALGKRLFVVRPTVISSLVLAALVLSSEIASAQLHGASVLKGCVSPKKVCATNADCPDASSCTGLGICTATLAERTIECTFEFENVDGFGDTLRIFNSVDAIRPGPGELVLTSMPIVAVSGTTTCTVGGSLPCDVAFGATVSFFSNQYVIQSTDPDPLPDQARVLWQDLCDAPGTIGCSTTLNISQASGATDLITGCGPGPTCTPTPTNTPITNTPTNTPTTMEGPPPPPVPTLSFPMMVLLGLLLAGTGLFLARRQ